MDNKDYIQLNDGTTIPLENAPVSAWRYYGYQLLFSIPILGIICLIAVALFAQNVNIRSFARSYFCGAIIVAILVGLLYLIAAPLLLNLIELIKDFITSF